MSKIFSDHVDYRVVEGEGVEKGIAIAQLGDMGNIVKNGMKLTSHNLLNNDNVP